MRWMVLLLLGWLVAGPAQARDMRIVTTVPTLAALADAVAGEHGKVTCLSVHTQDPHFVDARPHLVLELSKADLLVLTGLELEMGWLPTLLTGSRNGSIQPGSPGYLDGSQYVTVLQVPVTAVDRSMGDIHPGGNPHYHADPRAARQLVPAIADRLSTLDPEHADTYQANAAAFLGDLDAALVRWTEQAAPLKGVPVIDFHRAWPYLEDWLGFDIVADIEPKPGIPPTPKHVLHVVQLASQRDVKMVIQESWFPTNVSQTVADKAGAKLVVLDAQADWQGGQSYIEHIDGLVEALLAGIVP